MSQTSTSHNQWIRRAIAAAKAGNPSVAKIQLQKAAEAEPEDPVVWLWLGWLADSPASAAQCLELARSDERFRKVADSGIEFARALADFQFEEALPVVADDDSSEAVVDDTPTRNPVEFVDEVAAAVESLRLDDAAEPQDNTGKHEVVAFAPEISITTPAASDNEVRETDELAAINAPADEASIDEQYEPAVDDVAVDGKPVDEDASKETEEAVATTAPDTTVTADDLTTDEACEITRAIEAELMKSASELWQTEEVATAELPVDAELNDPSLPDGQPSWESASSNNSVNNVSMTPAEAAPSVEKFFEVCDDAEDDFVFASDADSDFSEGTPAHIEPAGHDGNAASAESGEDSWLGQASVDASRAPVWRKAKSDWFSVGGSSVSEKEFVLPATTSAESHDVPVVQAAKSSAVIVFREASVVWHELSVVDPLDVTPEVIEPVFDETSAGTSESEKSVELLPATVDAGSLKAPTTTPPALGPRVTVSDVWQKAAAEKSALAAAVRPPSPIASPADAAVFMIDDSQAARSTAAGGVEERLARKTVLVVDDSPTVRKLVAITLEKRGYKVVSAFDGVAAIKEIAAHNPSMILMDVNMPRLDGYQLCKLVKKHETTRNIPVLMLTGKDGMFDRLRGRLVGCAGYVAKPFAPEELVAAVEQHIHQSQEA